MTTNKRVRNTKTATRRTTNKTPELKLSMYTFIAAFMGVAVGFVASLAVVVPMLHNEFSNQSKQLSHQLVSMVPASTTLSSCEQPTVASNATASSTPPLGQVLGASTIASPVPMPPASRPPTTPAPNGEGQEFFTKLVGGVLAKTAASNNETGPSSTNTITTTNTSKVIVTNTNDVSTINTTSQTAVSGDATVSDNTTAGSAASGKATNDNSNATNLTITNN